MKKLIQTDFYWRFKDDLENKNPFKGSYLGKKPASFQTLRDFTRKNDCTGRGCHIIAIISPSYESNYISK